MQVEQPVEEGLPRKASFEQRPNPGEAPVTGGQQGIAKKLSKWLLTPGRHSVKLLSFLHEEMEAQRGRVDLPKASGAGWD